MAVAFKPAVKSAAKLRLGLAGPAGSGKTYSALAIAARLADGGTVAVVDTEHGSASKYSDTFSFDVLELESFHPERYIEAIHAAEDAGYAVLVIDSLSHAWMGKDGALELVDRAAKRSQSGNSYTAWRDVTPLHNALVEAMIQCRCHLIVTLRSKTEYVVETNERGRSAPRKVGLAPVQRDGMEYEMDVFGEMDQENNLLISKSRCPALSGQVIAKPGAQVAEALLAWLSGAPVEPKAQPAPEPSNEQRDEAEIKQAWDEWNYQVTCATAEGINVKAIPDDTPLEKLWKFTAGLERKRQEKREAEQQEVPA